MSPRGGEPIFSRWACQAGGLSVKSMENMRCGLTYSIADQNFAQTKSIGIYNLSVNLLRYLADREEVARLTVLSNRTVERILPRSGKTVVTRCDQAIRGRWSRLVWDQWGVYRAARQAGNEWLFLPKGFGSFLTKPPCRLAAYVHDTMHAFYRREYPGRLPVSDAWYFQRCLRATLREARVVFTNSDFTASEIRHWAKQQGLPPPRLVTAGIGFERPAVAAPVKQEAVVVLAGKWPHKLTGLAVRQVERWQVESGYRGRVEWVGQFPAGVVCPDRPGWQRHERLSEDAFRDLVGRSKALLYFSAYEGFGMPPVEAVLAGTCPVYSDLPATREAMEGVGMAFANDSYDSFRRALDSALAVTPAELSGWADRLLARHDWAQVAGRVIHGLSQAMESAGAGETRLAAHELD